MRLFRLTKLIDDTRISFHLKDGTFNTEKWSREVANRFELQGIRPLGDYEQSHSGTGRKAVAILRNVRGGRRITAQIGPESCTSWEDCKKAICDYLNRFNKIIDPSEIADPPPDLDLPWIRKAPVANQQTRYDAQNSLLTGSQGLDRSAGQSYLTHGQSEFSQLTPQDRNAAYLDSIGLGQQANFDNTEANFVWTDAAREAARLSKAAHKQTDLTTLHHGEKEDVNRAADKAVNHSAIALNARKPEKAEEHHRLASSAHQKLSAYHELRGHDEASAVHYAAHQAHEKAADVAASGKKQLAGASFGRELTPDNGGLQVDNDQPVHYAAAAFESAKHASMVNGSPESHAAAKASEKALDLSRRNAGMSGDCSYAMSSDPETSDGACAEAHQAAAILHRDAVRAGARVSVPHLSAADFHAKAEEAHKARAEAGSFSGAANFSATVDCTFDVSPVPSGSDGDMVIRDCPVIFKTGDYPDKGFSLTLDEAKRITLPDFESRKSTNPVRLRASHATNPLDGKLGRIHSLGISDDGTFSGKVAIPRWLDEAFKGQEIPLSAGFDRVSKRLTHLALVNDARIANAAIAAFERHQANASGNNGELVLSDSERAQLLGLTSLGQRCLASANSERRERRNELQGRYAKR